MSKDVISAPTPRIAVPNLQILNGLHQADTLEELLRLRADLMNDLSLWNEGAGTVVGFSLQRSPTAPTSLFDARLRRDRPAIIFFVKQKRELAALAPNQVIGGAFGRVFSASLKLWAYTDVIEIPKGDGKQLTNNEADFQIESLKSGAWGPVPGTAIREGGANFGSIGCPAQRAGNVFGFVTAGHLAPTGTDLKLPPNRPLGTVQKAFSSTNPENASTYLGGLLKRINGNSDDNPARFGRDCAFVKTDTAIPNEVVLSRRAFDLLRGHIPEASPSEATQPVVRLPLKFPAPGAAVGSLQGMWPIGEDVYSLGASTGLRLGRVVGFSTLVDGGDRPVYEDYLIQSRQPDKLFSAPGDSGKLVITINGNRPLALCTRLANPALASIEQHFTPALAIERALAALDATFPTV